MKNIQIFLPLIAAILFGIYSWIPIRWRIQKNPQLAPGYYKLMLGWFVWLNTPLIAGLLKPLYENQEWARKVFAFLGREPSTWPNLIAIAIAVIWGSVWIFFMRGDETLEKYPGLFMFPVGRAERIRLYWIVFACFLLLSTYTPWTSKIFPSLSANGNNIDNFPPVYFPFFFLGMWVLVSFFLSIISGWQWLSESYIFKDKFEGRKHSGISGMLGCVSFRSVLTLGADSNGLFLGVLFPFRLGHPPLLIPWDEITCKKRRFLIKNYAVLEFQKAPGVFLMIPEKIVRTLSEESGNRRAFKGLE